MFMLFPQSFFLTGGMLSLQLPPFKAKKRFFADSRALWPTFADRAHRGCATALLRAGT